MFSHSEIRGPCFLSSIYTLPLHILWKKHALGFWLYVRNVFQEKVHKVETCFLSEWTVNDYTCWCHYDWHYYSMYGIFINFSDLIFPFPSLFLSSVWQCKGIAGLLWRNLLRSETFDDLWRRVSIGDFNHRWIVGGVESRAGLCNSQYLLHKIGNVIILLHIIDYSLFSSQNGMFLREFTYLKNSFHTLALMISSVT